MRNRACLQKGRACVFVLSHKFSKYAIYLCYESLHRLELGFLQILLGYVYYSQCVLERRCTFKSKQTWIRSPTPLPTNCFT